MNVETMNNAEYRKFGFIMALFIALLFGLFFPWVFDKSISFVPWAISAVFVLLALLAPKALVVVHKPWMFIGHYLGIVNTKIILGIVFFLIFTPMALILKLLGKDYMKREFGNKTKSSFWEISNKQPKDHMENIY